MNKGFTLIELMIVVAIIAILAAIALPAYQNRDGCIHLRGESRSRCLATLQGRKYSQTQPSQQSFGSVEADKTRLECVNGTQVYVAPNGTVTKDTDQEGNFVSC